jgi:hypothetical protein
VTPRKASHKTPRKRKAAAIHPEEWSVEPRDCVETLADFLAPHLTTGVIKKTKMLIYDPSCGGGNILNVFRDRGFPVAGSDIVNRGAFNFIGNRDFVESPRGFDRPFSIVMNPPYTKAEGFLRQAFRIATHFVAAILPMSFLGSAKRYQFYLDHPPLYVAYLSDRPSMPPGDKVDELGPSAFKNGRILYCWIIWDVRQRNPMTRSVWLKRK